MVLLDRNGNLMVDPSVIEKSWSHRTVASSGSHHLGGVYIKNLRKCIENLTDTHSNYEPNFWERKDEAEDVEKVEDEEEVFYSFLDFLFFLKGIISTHTFSNNYLEKYCPTSICINTTEPC